MNLLKRHTVFYIDMKTLINRLENNETIDYRKVGIRLNYKFALCQILYMNRKISINPYTLYVQDFSYNADRIKIVEYIVEEVLIAKYQLGNSKQTLQSNMAPIMQFINWADERKLTFENLTNARNTYILYTQWLKTKIRKGDYASSTASLNQHAALSMLSSLVDDKKNEIGVSVRNIPGIGRNSIKKSSDYEQKTHINFYYAMFHQITDFLLNEKQYPCKLNLSGKIVWAIPKNTIFISANNKNIYVAFDYNTGNIRSADEIRLLRKDKYIYQANDAKRHFAASLETNNKNMKSNQRLILGSKALYAFYMLFLSITGMNDSTAASLLWNGEYDIEKNHQNFRNIKYRAGGKVVEFKIQKKFIGDFRKFLKLREFVLNGYSVDTLYFMGCGEKAYISKKQSDGGFSSYINEKMRETIDPSLPRLASRKMRVNKTHFTVNKNGVVAASELAQSSQETIIKSYLGETQVSTDKQLSNFFTKLNSNVIFVDEKSSSVSVGQCVNYGNPKTNVSVAGVSTDCTQSEGCLFCEYYGCHADEVDVRKLLSLLYIINECRYIFKTDENHKKVYGIVIDKIEEILDQIKNYNSKMPDIVSKIKYDVFENENLDYYWEYKLALLIDMGLIK